MANASLDQNSIASLTGALNTTGDTIVKVQADASTHALLTDDGTTGSDHGPTDALHDENGRPSLLAVSSQTITVNGVDYMQGVTPVVIYADASGHLLTDSA